MPSGGRQDRTWPGGRPHGMSSDPLHNERPGCPRARRACTLSVASERTLNERATQHRDRFEDPFGLVAPRRGALRRVARPHTSMASLFAVPSTASQCEGTAPARRTQEPIRTRSRNFRENFLRAGGGSVRGIVFRHDCRQTSPGTSSRSSTARATPASTACSTRPRARAQAFAERYAGKRRRARRRRARRGRCTSSRRSPSSPAAPATTRCCASASTPPTRRSARCCSACRSAARRSRRSCCSSSSSGPRSTTSAPTSCSPPTGLDFCRHYLRTARRYRPHLLTEPEERILTEKSVTGAQRLGAPVQRARLGDRGRRCRARTSRSRSTRRSAELMSPDRDVRRGAAEAVTAALEPGLRTRAFIFNTLLHDKAVDDRLRNYPNWLAAPQPRQRGLRRVRAGAGRGRARPLRASRGAGTALKAQLLGIDQLADYDRMAAVTQDDEPRRRGTTRASSCSTPTRRFSPELGDLGARVLRRALASTRPPRPGKRGGAFCAYTVPVACTRT